ncbi:LADA_0G06194g1_1 [Lachancea dasiensis]|uniref:Nuclear mRNA export factor n=1 Tax=Lachancea dasiensis TaxID=1072105 RepID=A0A1G4JT30_9SACH|nr:LADA_0G06194g1_1 [Lachancea dasiensis]
MSFAVGAPTPSPNFSFFSNSQSSGSERGPNRRPKGNRFKGRNHQKQVNAPSSTVTNIHLPPTQTKRTSSAIIVNDVIAKVDNTGMLTSLSPEALGFKPISHEPRSTPKYLIQQRPCLRPRCYAQDSWDRENQQQMLKKERTIADATELWETLKKMREVERRVMEDKELVDRADFAKDLNDAIEFQGTCQDMCPIFERARRSVENNVVRYEKDDERSRTISRQKALKVFARPAAAAAPPLPSDVRPPQVLVRTLDYIVDNILPKLPDCEGFLWDRMRSIRQDFTYQNYSGPEAIDCNERIVRIHLLILHVTARSDVEYSLQQELEQLHKALITLSEIYDEVRASGGQAPNEAEFRAYSLLSRIRDPEYDKMAQSLPKPIFDNSLVQLALCFRRIVSNSTYSERGHIKTENGLNLYQRFFELLKSNRVPFLMSSFLEVYLNEVRFYALKSLAHALNKKHKPVPVSFIREHLMFNDEDEVIKLCEHYSVEVSAEGIKLSTLTHHSHIIPEATPLKQSYLRVVDGKLLQSTPQALINSGKPNVDTIPSGDSSEQPQTQFNENYRSTAREEVSESPSNSSKSIQHLSQVSKLETSPKVDFANMTDNLARNVEATKQSKEDNKETNQNAKVEKAYETNIQEKIDEQRRIKETREREIFVKEPADVSGTDANLEKADDKIKERIEASKWVADKIIRNVVHEQTSLIAKEQLRKRSRKVEQLQQLTNELYQAFLHEKLYLTALQTQAEIAHDTTCLRHGWKLWRGGCTRRRDQLEKKRLHMEEIAKVSRQLGVPDFKRLKVDATPTSNFSFIMPLSSQRDIVHTPVTNEKSHFKTPLRKNPAVWEVLDLEKLYLEPIVNNACRTVSEKAKQSKEALKFNISLYARNWDSISARWLLSKFGLQNSTSRSLLSKRQGLSLEIRHVAHEFSPKDFESLQLLVFNSGVTENDIFDLEMKLKQDGEKLIELAHGVALNTNYRFSIMVVYWESTENPLTSEEISRALKLTKMSKIFASALETVEVIKLTGDDPHVALQRNLSKIAKCCSLNLTERGIYNASLRNRNSQASSVTSIRYQSSRELDSKLRRALEQETRKYEQERNKPTNTYAYLQSHVAASPRVRKRKLPVLLSDSHRNKFKTPLAVRPFIKRSTSGSSSSIPTSEPSHLAVKVRLDGHFTLADPGVSWTTPLPSRTKHEPMSASRLATCNTSGISNVTFESPISTPSERLLPANAASTSTTTDQQETSDSVLELKHLIASVKKSLNKY